MDLVDTHCHIHSIGALAGDGDEVTAKLWAKMKDDRTIDDVVSEATDADVTRLIAVGCTTTDSQLAQETALKYDNIWATIGIHPHEAKVHLDDSASIEAFKQLVIKPKVVAIGECGLDYYYQHSPKEDQQKILELQLTLALEHNLPLIFHVRDAFDDFWPIFDSFNSTAKPIRGVLHSFTDNHKNLDRALRANLFIGVNGIATFTKDPDQTEVYRQIPLSSMVLETDSPFLTPAPIRGNINEPKNVAIIARYLGDLRGEELSHLAVATTNNSLKLFSIN